MKLKMSAIFRSHSKDGFAFIMALLAMLLLTSLGLLVFSLTMKDQITAAKLAGEKRAFSATEHALNTVLLNFQPGTAAAGANVNNISTWPQTDSATDPNTRYYYSIPATVPGNCAPPPGFNSEYYTGACYAVDIRGANVNFVSQQQLTVGVRVGMLGSTSGNFY